MIKLNLTGPQVPLDRGWVELWQINGEWLNFTDSDGNEMELHISEIANIPQVKALIDALESAKEQIRHDNEGCAEYQAVDANLGVSEWEAFMPTAWHKINAAFALFSMSPGDNEK